MGITKDTIINPKTAAVSIVRPIIFPTPKEIKKTSVCLHESSGGVFSPIPVPDMSLFTLESSSLKNFLCEREQRKTVVRADLLYFFENAINDLSLDASQEYKLKNVFLNNSDLLCLDLEFDEYDIKEERIALAGLIRKVYGQKLCRNDIEVIYNRFQQSIAIAKVNPKMLSYKEYKFIRDDPYQYFIDMLNNTESFGDYAKEIRTFDFDSIVFGGLCVAIKEDGIVGQPPRIARQRDYKHLSRFELSRLKMNKNGEDSD